jgi:hypothetical protein
MAFETNIDAVTATGAGSTITTGMIHRDPDSLRGNPTTNLPRTLWQIQGISTASVAIQGSIDGTNWITLETYTADDLVEVVMCPYMRANVTVYTAGTISVFVHIP